MNVENEKEEVQGSWTPFILLTLLLLLRWLVYGESNGAVGIRRWYNMQVS